MKDETKHAIAKQIAFAIPLFLLGMVIMTVWILLAGYNPLKEFSGGDAAITWMMSCIPLVLGYCYKLYKWVMKWK